MTKQALLNVRKIRNNVKIDTTKLHNKLLYNVPSDTLIQIWDQYHNYVLLFLYSFIYYSVKMESLEPIQGFK